MIRYEPVIRIAEEDPEILKYINCKNSVLICVVNSPFVEPVIGSRKH